MAKRAAQLRVVVEELGPAYIKVRAGGAGAGGAGAGLSCEGLALAVRLFRAGPGAGGLAGGGTWSLGAAAAAQPARRALCMCCHMHTTLPPARTHAPPRRSRSCCPRAATWCPPPTSPSSGACRTTCPPSARPRRGCCWSRGWGGRWTRWGAGSCGAAELGIRFVVHQGSCAPTEPSMLTAPMPLPAPAGLRQPQPRAPGQRQPGAGVPRAPAARARRRRCGHPAPIRVRNCWCCSHPGPPLHRCSADVSRR